MSKIKIRHFGPIEKGFLEDNGWLDIKKVTVFTGNQGSGKSTVAKLVSTFTWIEKVLNRGDYKVKDFTDYNRFRKTFCAYHRIENYFFDLEGNDTAELEFKSKTFHFKYHKGNLTIKKIESKEPYHLPQIMYVPAERNFIANVKTPKALKLTSDSLVEFVTEFDRAKNEMKGAMKLPIDGDLYVEYQKLNDIIYIKGKNHRIQLKEASSGIQSIVPLYLVSWFLSDSVKKQSESSQIMSSEEMDRFRKGVEEIWMNDSFTEEQRRVALSVLSSKFNKTAFVNIVEEPEQNLFPGSQREMIHNLLKYNNKNKANKLIITTHSPYLINYLTIATKAGILLKKLKAEHKKKLNEVVPLDSVINPDDIVIYELSEKDGSISRLTNFEGIPSDNNYLNIQLGLSNKMYDSLLEIEEEL
jgi:predicted ATPase